MQSLHKDVQRVGFAAHLRALIVEAVEVGGKGSDQLLGGSRCIGTKRIIIVQCLATPAHHNLVSTPGAVYNKRRISSNSVAFSDMDRMLNSFRVNPHNRVLRNCRRRGFTDQVCITRRGTILSGALLNSSCRGG